MSDDRLCNGGAAGAPPNDAGVEPGGDAEPPIDAACATCQPDSEAGTSLCVPGMYVGEFDMNYTPGPAGLCGIVGGFKGTIHGRWALQLERSGGNERSAQVNGCIEAVADRQTDAGAVNAIRSLLTGTLDCVSGELVSQLQGTYSAVSFCDLGVVTRDYFFRGPNTARFDPQSQSFVEGALVVLEPPVLIGSTPGGDATWTASLSDDAGFVAGDPASCLNGVEFDASLFGDAAVP